MVILVDGSFDKYILADQEQNLSRLLSVAYYALHYVWNIAS